MREFKESEVGAAKKTFQTKARGAIVEEKQCDLAIKKKLVNFYICKDLVCIGCLLLMLAFVLTGQVTGGVFLVSQVINAIIRGRGKGLQRITESEFPVGDRSCG
jgi:hypothetical protein